MHVKELGHLVLYVRNLDRSRHFYRDLLGWKEITVPGEEIGFPAAAFSSGRTHHELLLIEVGEDAAPIPKGRRVGMYHFGIKIGDTDAELREARDQLVAAGARLVGTADHTITHSLYIEDPDGNEIELYIDVQPAVWKDDPAAIFARPRPLRPESARSRRGDRFIIVTRSRRADRMEAMLRDADASLEKWFRGAKKRSASMLRH